MTTHPQAFNDEDQRFVNDIRSRIQARFDRYGIESPVARGPLMISHAELDRMEDLLSRWPTYAEVEVMDDSGPRYVLDYSQPIVRNVIYTDRRHPGSLLFKGIPLMGGA